MVHLVKCSKVYSGSHLELRCFTSRTQTVDFKEGRTVAVKVLEGKRFQKILILYLQDQRVEIKEYRFANAKNKQHRL